MRGGVLGSGIFDAGNTQAAATQPGGFIAELKRFGAGLELIGEGQAAELGQFAVFAPANAERPAAAVVGFDSVSGGHGLLVGDDGELLPGSPGGLGSNVLTKADQGFVLFASRPFLDRRQS
jgi:hypothetical protein